MIVEINVHGAPVDISVIVNSDGAEGDDEEAARLAGLSLDDMLSRASDYALRTFSTAAAVVARMDDTAADDESGE